MSRFTSRSVCLSLVLLSVVAISGCKRLASSAIRGAMMGANAKAVHEISDDDFVQMFEQVNKFCPRKIDKWTKLVEVKVLDDQFVEYRYEVSDEGRRMLSRVSKQAMRQSMIQMMRGNPVAVAIAERDLVIDHIYRDRSGAKLMSFAITRSMLDGSTPDGMESANPFAVTTVDASSEDLSETALPQKVSTAPKRSKDNPFGIHQNPFAD